MSKLPSIIPEISEAPELEIDLSKVVDLEEQRNFCKTMIQSLMPQNKELKIRLMESVEIDSFLGLTFAIKQEIGEYVGYYYGSINQSMTMFESALVNLKQFDQGKYDDVEANARGMFLSLWYNVATMNAQLAEVSLRQLEEMENQMLSKHIDPEQDEELVIDKVVIN